MHMLQVLKQFQLLMTTTENYKGNNHKSKPRKICLENGDNHFQSKITKFPLQFGSALSCPSDLSLASTEFDGADPGMPLDPRANHPSASFPGANF